MHFTLRPFFSSLIIILFLALGACSGPAPQTPAAVPSPARTSTPTPLPTPVVTPTSGVLRATLSIWHSWDEAHLPALVQIIDEFQQQYPDILFDVLYVPQQDLLARYQSEYSQGSGPGLLLGPAAWGPQLYEAGQTADLSDVVEPALLDTLNQPALGAARQQDALIGLPYSLQGVVLFRNKDIVTLAPNTFDELVTLAQTSTEGKTLGAVLERGFFSSGAHMNGLGGSWVDENGQPAFANATGLAWVELLSLFEQAGPAVFRNDEDLEAFKQGRAGWIIDGTWNLPTLAEAIGPERLAVDPWPTYENGRLSGYLLADNIYLNPQTQGSQAEAARLFMRHFISPTAQTYMAEVGRIPTASGVRLSDPQHGPLMAQAMAALAGGSAYPLDPQFELYSDNLDIALHAIFTDGVPPEQALQAAQDVILAELGQVAPSPTP